MSDPLLAAIIAASAALIVAFLNSILAEVFRRYRDRKSLAAAIAGELASYEPALPIIQQILRTTIQTIEAEARNTVVFRPFEKPKDFVFEKAVERLGLLGPKLAEDVVYVYSNLNAFRVSFGLISTHFIEMSDAEAHARCVACLDAVERTAQRGKPLIAALKNLAGT
ncbi:hypothetical protein ELE36_01815 [Pseudolysobacter antarcticus]|uniref:DUF4760 domain-containing protein n=1 Tax=Pseudolysobacter antarcticus TaxID=2511995 RepID=A0A411HFE4_9GAMM|nr:hypothetical protein [Pseudolysobacter antarcticus]QBB69213.1 hypothetical protein ELE36_01815 [Pseudolysobacter antarcticus]